MPGMNPTECHQNVLWCEALADVATTAQLRLIQSELSRDWKNLASDLERSAELPCQKDGAATG